MLGHDPPPQQAGLAGLRPDLGQVGEDGVADRHLVERKQVVGGADHDLEILAAVAGRSGPGSQAAAILAPCVPGWPCD